MTEPSSPGPAVDHYELNSIKRDVGTDVLMQLVDLFCDSVPDRLTALRDSVQSADTAAAAAVLHSLISSASNLGAAHFGELILQAERLARAGRTAELAALIEPLEVELARTTACLQEYRATLES